jgi:hypothetical protein
MAAKKYLTLEGLSSLVSEIKTYVNNIASNKADSSHTHDDRYYTKTQIDNYELITVDDIDTICGGTIQAASEVNF